MGILDIFKTEEQILKDRIMSKRIELSNMRLKTSLIKIQQEIDAEEKNHQVIDDKQDEINAWNERLRLQMIQNPPKPDGFFKRKP